jgi:hypothetical protein
MNPALHQRVLALMSRYDIGYFDYAGPDGVLTLDAEVSEQGHSPITASRAGIFLWSHPADRSHVVWPRRVEPGDVIGWLKIGPLLEPVRANEAAMIRRPRLVDGTLAGYGDRIF